VSTSQGPLGAASGVPGRSGAQALRKLALPAFEALPARARRAVLHALDRYAPWEDGFDFTPPPIGLGEVTGPPDFVGIGAQKSGTTWWYDLIAAHPEVACREDIHKERHFFDRYVVRPFGPDDRSCYHGWFPRPHGMVTGEWTPDYMHLPWVPALLAEAAPDARLLVLLRDPVERFVSGLSHHRRHGGTVSAEVHADAVARGFYHQALGQWTSHFSPEQVLLLQYERCVADPGRELARTYRFLGLSPFVPENLHSRVSGTKIFVLLDADARRRLVDLYGPDVVALATDYPDLALDLGLWPNFASVAAS
jgi:hypothetical protein